MYGPGTNLAHGGSLIFHSDCQMRYITECLELLIADGHRSIEPREDKATDWHERSQAEMRKMVWSQPSVKHSFYKNSFGEVHILSPWRLVDYWAWTREPNPDDFVIRYDSYRQQTQRHPNPRRVGCFCVRQLPRGPCSRVIP